MLTCRNTSAIWSGVSPLRRAARTCSASSASCRSTASAASVSMLRSERDRTGLDQTSPQAYRVMKSWKSLVNSVVPATARSTWSSPSTCRRTVIPCAARSASSMLASGAGAWYIRAGTLPISRAATHGRTVRGEGRIDERPCRPEVAGGVERGVEPGIGDSGLVEPLPQVGDAQQRLAQRHVAGDRPGAGLRDQVVGGDRADDRGQQPGYPLG